jgi:hypothetical protein
LPGGNERRNIHKRSPSAMTRTATCCSLEGRSGTAGIPGDTSGVSKLWSQKKPLPHHEGNGLRVQTGITNPKG